jgi:hypothetical protein
LYAQRVSIDDNWTRAMSPSLMDLPRDVLGAIMTAADQTTRATCMHVCKGMHEAACAPGAWRDVTFYDLDASAVDFMAAHRCEHVRILGASPDDISWFFERLQMADIACIASLEIRMHAVQRVPTDLLHGIGAQRELRHLDIGVDDVDQISEVSWPATHQLTKLETMRIVEACGGSRQLIVWFDGSHARFSSLRHLDLRVGLSDVLKDLRHMPALRHMVYHSDEDGGETYEDARLEHVVLDTLELDVGCDTDSRTLFRELHKARVRHLVLHLHDDWLDVDQKMCSSLETLTLSMHVTKAEIRVDFPFLQEYELLKSLRLTIGAPWIYNEPLIEGSCQFDLHLRHLAGDIRAFVRFLDRVDLGLHDSTRLVLA